MTLVEFLLARISEDENHARAAIEGPWWNHYGDVHTLAPVPDEVRSVAGWTQGNGPHIARWDPTRVLAECETKRQIVEDAVTYDPQPHVVWRGGGIAPSVLALLALPYADHPDYHEEWRP